MRYGDVLPRDFFQAPCPFWLKKDLTDKGNPFTSVVLKKNSTVMDCGGNIGTFAAACILQGARLVVVYEPVPKNFLDLQKNLNRYGKKVELIQAALVSSPSKPNITMSLSGFSGAHSMCISSKSTKTVKVPAICFRKELLRISPEVVKIDVEGAEYELMNSLFPGDFAKVECVHIEFHPIENRTGRMKTIAKYLNKEGLFCVQSGRRSFVMIRNFLLKP